MLPDSSQRSTGITVRFCRVEANLLIRVLVRTFSPVELVGVPRRMRDASLVWAVAMIRAASFLPDVWVYTSSGRATI